MISKNYVVYQLLLFIFCALLGIGLIHLAYLFALFNCLNL
jgi:hypothetical protein